MCSCKKEISFLKCNKIICFFLIFLSFQSMVVGQPGAVGVNVPLNVDEELKSVCVPVLIQHHSMVECLVLEIPSKRHRVTHFVLVSLSLNTK